MEARAAAADSDMGAKAATADSDMGAKEARGKELLTDRILALGTQPQTWKPVWGRLQLTLWLARGKL
ncbi:hypothetical protein E1301_Tti017642 [Triplophysa tibetana]|uniref:Uncharacterized protein n=1 Tax=Triplophysa tibetana TaxID=1572043 RepID=A0A5A9NLY4_9TELE|nr:hypothetical protein E1301_Tti017642 [Triplophysa tibetana]